MRQFDIVTAESRRSSFVHWYLIRPIFHYVGIRKDLTGMLSLHFFGRACSACSGTGKRECTACDGRGYRQYRTSRPGEQERCDVCYGKGYLKCSGCNGSGSR